MKKFLKNYFLIIFSGFLLLFIQLCCSGGQNPNDPDLKNWPKERVKYYSRIKVDELNRYSFEQEYQITEEDLNNIIHHYQVLFNADGTIYKFNEYFEKVAGAYPKLYSFVYPKYYSDGKVFNQRIYKRIGEKEQDFTLVYELFSIYDPLAKQLIRQEGYTYPGKCYLDLPLVMIQNSIRRNNMSNFDPKEFSRYIKPDVVLTYENEILVKRESQISDKESQIVQYNYDYEGNRLSDDYYLGNDIRRKIKYDESGFARTEENFKSSEQSGTSNGNESQGSNHQSIQGQEKISPSDQQKSSEEDVNSMFNENPENKDKSQQDNSTQQKPDTGNTPNKQKEEDPMDFLK